MYTVTDAAWYVGVARQTMSDWIKTGRVHPVYRPSRTCVRIPASSVNRYLKRQGRGQICPSDRPSKKASRGGRRTKFGGKEDKLA